jgi:hypothetical protein
MNDLKKKRILHLDGVEVEALTVRYIFGRKRRAEPEPVAEEITTTIKDLDLNIESRESDHYYRNSSQMDLSISEIPSEDIYSCGNDTEAGSLRSPEITTSSPSADSSVEDVGPSPAPRRRRRRPPEMIYDDREEEVPPVEKEEPIFLTGMQKERLRIEQEKKRREERDDAEDRT